MSTSAPLSTDDFLAALREESARYHDRHPFHLLLHEGRLSRAQLQAWVANRYAYQACLPRKDAAIIANCPETEVRREWIARIRYHDGDEEGTGGLAAWLQLAEGVGLDPDEVREGAHVLPAVRFAVEAYVTFCRTRPWVEAVASSLTEQFAPGLMARRLVAMEEHYPWIDPEGLSYFRRRIDQAPRDAAHALRVVTDRCTTAEAQQAALGALRFKCEVLWAILDAIHLVHVLGSPQP